MNIANYIGIPYLDGGRTPEGGDCWFLIWYIYQKEFGILLPSFSTVTYYGTGKEELGTTIEEGLKKWKRIPEEEATFADIIIFKICNHCAHVAFFLEKEKMLHLCEGYNSVVENYNSAMWRKRIEGFYRYEK